MREDKVAIFFNLLRAAYGADVIDRKWPSPADKQLVMAMKREAIEKLTVEEIRGAIDNACAQKAKGLDEFLFLDIDLIISGAKRYGNASHKMFLPEPEESDDDKKKKKLDGAEKARLLKELFSPL